MEPIRTTRNPRLQRVRALQRTTERRDNGVFVVEGEDLVDAAIRAGAQFDDLLVSEDFVAPHIVGIVPLVVQTEILATLSSVRSGSRVIGVVRRESLPTPPKTLTGVALALCGVGDPGNVGTLLRSAAAFNTEVVVLGAPAADPTSPKAVRAGMGATFFVPTLTLDDPADAYPEARLVALDGAGETDLNDVDFAGPVVIALGAERGGLPHSIRKRADVICRIPQSDKVESLNVAAAGAIVLALSYRSNA